MSSAGRELVMLRTQQGFVPWGDEAVEQLKRIKLGQFCRVIVRVIRNWEFHKKVFTLLAFAYEQSEPPCGENYKSPDRFRKDLTIKAGYYEQHYSILEQRIVTEAKSISFGAMGQQEFEEFFRALKRAVWDLVMAQQARYTEAEWENVLAQLLEYDA